MFEEKNLTISVRVTPEERDFIDKWASAMNVSISKLLRIIIKKYQGDFDRMVKS